MPVAAGLGSSVGVGEGSEPAMLVLSVVSMKTQTSQKRKSCKQALSVPERRDSDEAVDRRVLERDPQEERV